MVDLVSPGVSVTVTDESFYASAGTGTVPLILLATGQDKPSPDGSGVAQNTTAAEAGKVKLITSQRELLTTYGNPNFVSLNGTPLNGHELNEYGLQAAYSFLGIANRAYVLRADIDLSELESNASEPTAKPADGEYWLDTSSSQIGLKAWDGTNWVSQPVRVPTSSSITASEPKQSYGVDGWFAVVYWDSQGNTLDEIKIYEKIAGAWYHVGSNAWDGAAGFDFQIAPHTSLPVQNSAQSGLVAGDLVLQTTSPNNGTVISLRIYDSPTDQFTSVDSVSARFSRGAYEQYALTGGVNEGDLWLDFTENDATISIKRHNGLRENTAISTVALADDDVSAANHTANATAFTIQVNNSSTTVGNAGIISVTFDGFDDGDGNLSVDEMVEAINSALSNADANDTDSDDLIASNVDGRISIVSSSGYDIQFGDGVVSGFAVSDMNLTSSEPYSNWEDLDFEASQMQITGTIDDGRLWYDTRITTVDLLINDEGDWTSYTTGGEDVQVAASEPTQRADGSGLATNDIWISSADLEEYPRIYKYTNGAWVELDTSDQESSNGVLFADFRTDTSSSVMDNDAPNPALYPYGMLAWNKRASGGNVKQWSAANQRWEDYSGNKADGSPAMFRKARRRAVVRQLQATITSNTDIRNETNRFNLIACPGYPELLDEMVSLNVDRKETAFIITDAPLRLNASATATQAWANNSNNAIENGEDGLVTNYEYSAVYYPHGLTTALDGTNIVVPASHIALRTLAFNDQVAFPWFAPAGFQRGVVTNATNVGYIDAQSAEFQAVQLSERQRDSLYVNKINPIAQFPGRGISVFGQKTLSPTTSALDRVNVARLVVYIRERLDDIVRPFLFEPNDEITRANAKAAVDRFLGSLVSQRGLFDFLVVVDSSNNTPARIDRNEMYIDIAIQPLKAVEFIYIPIRVQNTLGQTG